MFVLLESHQVQIEILKEAQKSEAEGRVGRDRVEDKNNIMQFINLLFSNLTMSELTKLLSQETSCLC